MPTDNSTDALSAELQELNRLLLDCPDEDETMLLSELDGYIAGTLVDPHPVPAEMWLPRIWGGAAEAFPDDPARSARLVELVLARREEIVGDLLRGDLAYAPVYDVDPRDDEPLWEIWVEGFTAAMALSGKSWDPLLETGDEDLDAAFLGLTVYVAMVRGLRSEGTDDEDMLADAPDIIPYLVETLYRRQHGLDRIVLASAPIVAAPKIGRNERCPCGSGKKFKKCCGA
ncbi:MAG TPA: UPF0149 family protein [Allosphingosinicella sp.]|jgi:uncharacterized protein